VNEKWRVVYTAKRPHSAVGHMLPAPEACSLWGPNPSSQPIPVIQKISHSIWIKSLAGKFIRDGEFRQQLIYFKCLASLPCEPIPIPVCRGISLKCKSHGTK